MCQTCKARNGQFRSTQQASSLYLPLLPLDTEAGPSKRSPPEREQEGASHLGDHKHPAILRRAFSLWRPFTCCLPSSEATELTATETAQRFGFKRTCENIARLKLTILRKWLGVVGTGGVPDCRAELLLSICCSVTRLTLNNSRSLFATRCRPRHATLSRLLLVSFLPATLALKADEGFEDQAKQEQQHKH